jgi:hypothetical protein
LTRLRNKSGVLEAGYPQDVEFMDVADALDAAPRGSYDRADVADLLRATR